MIDLLTDSGTSAMSDEQWAGMLRGDESYAGSRSWYRFESVLKQSDGYAVYSADPSGPASERILFELIGGPGKVIPSNNHFDTTRANIEHSGAKAVDLVIDEGLKPQSRHPFKGNLDPGKLESSDRECRTGADSRLHDHRHEQHRRRPAGQPGEHQSDPSDLSIAIRYPCSSTPADLPKMRISSNCESPDSRTGQPGKSPRRCSHSPMAPPSAPRKTDWLISAGYS